MQKEVSVVLERNTVASIDANRCSNCGKCRDYCPVHAISEKQKAVCHLCPDCTEIKPISSQEIIDMQNIACTLSCPLGISPQGFIQLFKSGKEKEAFEIIWDKNPLPLACGFVCHHPCETDCKRGKLVDSPMEIRSLQRYLSAKMLDWKPSKYPVTRNETIAVIGGGPAGLTAAHWLSKRGYSVTIFDQNSEPGGMLIRGIPGFRVDKDMVRKEIRRLEEAGIKIVTNARIDPSLKGIRNDFDRIVIAAGKQLSRLHPACDRGIQEVYGAVEFMEKANAGADIKLSGEVVVIGGGSVAVDTARTAVRLGAKKVTMICLESGDAIPAHKWELEEAFAEGIEIIEGANVTAFHGYPGNIHSLDYVKIRNFDPKKFSFESDPDTQQTLPADHVIVAIGQASDVKWPEGEGIVFAGDLVTGQCSVVDAMASGRAAAIQIDNELRGRTYQEYETNRAVEPGDLAYKIYPAMRLKLDFKHPEKLSASECTGLNQVTELMYSDDNAYLETYRCMGCGYEYVDPTKCIGCGVCEKICPKGDVITMTAIPAEN